MPKTTFIIAALVCAMLGGVSAEGNAACGGGTPLCYPDAENDNVTIAHNYVGQNGGISGSGGERKTRQKVKGGTAKRRRKTISPHW